MRDMNDMYVGDYCPTKVHCRGYVFSISELVTIAMCYLPYSELQEHRDTENVEQNS